MYMKFVIRDDDLNYFSKPADIEEWYQGIFAQGIPVGFAAIPFVKPVSDVYPANIPPSDEEHPIHENVELVEYVKNSPYIEVLQHGTTHETKDRKFEYARKVPLGEAKRGREELEKAFGCDVSIFVPPHDWIGSSGIYSVEHAGMNVIRGRGAGLRNWILRPAYIRNFFKMLRFKRSARLSSGKSPAYPFVLDFGKHKEVCTYRLEDEDVFEGLQYAYRRNGIFVVVVHVHGFTHEKKEQLARLISTARSYDAEFVKPSDLFTTS